MSYRMVAGKQGANETFHQVIRPHPLDGIRVGGDMHQEMATHGQSSE